jgi:hypothetical protein
MAAETVYWCDAGRHRALMPWRYGDRILCPNCLLRALSDAIRSGEALEAEPVETEKAALRAPSLFVRGRR